jgi:hypothetical protein
MSESLKFGPEWLRNSIATSPTKQDDTISRPVLSENRYSREEMLSFCENSNGFKADPHSTCAKMYNDQWQIPLAFQTEEREKEEKLVSGGGAAPNGSHSGRLFVNSNLKGSVNWRKNHIPSNEEKLPENWRNQRDSGGTGVYYNNTYSEF